MTDKLRAKMINAGRVLVDEGQGDYVWGHISARLPDDPHEFLDAGADRLLRLGNERLLFRDSRGGIEQSVDPDDQPEQDRGRDQHLDQREAVSSWRWHREIGHKRTVSCCAVPEKGRPSDARRPSRA